MHFPSIRSSAVIIFGAVLFAACGETPASAPDMNTAPLSLNHVSSVTGNSVSGVYYAGNPTCTELGYDFGFKVDNNGGTNVNGTWEIPGFGSVTVDGDGTEWDWTSTFPINGVYSKGGEKNGGQLYDYGAEGSLGDSGHFSGFNSSDPPVAQGISHIDFCFNAGGLTVSKTAITSFTRDFDWSIDKTAAPADSYQWDIRGEGNLTVNSGNSAMVDYTVAVAQTGSTDSDWAVDGVITITNNTGISATITSITDQMSDGTAGVVSCPLSLPTTLAAGGSIVCSYSAMLPNANGLVNMATAETDPANSVTVSQSNGDVWKLYGSGYVKSGSGLAPVIFGAPTLVLDATVSVSDTWAEFGNARIMGNGDSHTYSVTFGGSVCGSTQYVNTASFDQTTGQDGSASYAVTLDIVGCDNYDVCTLTQGYWKTHSSFGPAAHPDETWGLLANGPNTMFFDSGLSWHTVFWTAPRGNAYIILAHQYMAAVLNQLNGADTSAIDQTLADAQALFAGITGSSFARNSNKTAKQLAETLDNYNNGLIGPGHCSDAPRN